MVSEDNDMLLYLGTLIFLSLRLGQGPSLVACVVSLTFLSLGRAHSGFAIVTGRFEYLISFALFLSTTHIVSKLSTRVQLEAWKEQQRAEALKYLHSFSRLCGQAGSLEELERHTRRVLTYNLGLECCEPLEEDAIMFLGTESRFGVRPPTGGGETGFWRAYLQSLQTVYLDSLQILQQADSLRQASIFEETQRLQSALINSLSHDIQTPLSSILGTFELLRDQTLEFPPERRGKLLELGHSQTQRLLHFCRNIINLGKLEGGALKPSCSPLTLDDTVPPALELLDQYQRSRVRLSVATEEAWVLGDRLLLTQIVFNLVDNALKFSSPESSVEVEVARSEEKAVLTVSDRGVGVLSQERQLIFERFQRGTVPERVPGSGLGLHISRELAHLHEGSLEVEARPERGSRFVLKLPLYDTKAGRPPLAERHKVPIGAGCRS